MKRSAFIYSALIDSLKEILKKGELRSDELIQFRGRHRRFLLIRGAIGGMKNGIYQMTG